MVVALSICEHIIFVETEQAYCAVTGWSVAIGEVISQKLLKIIQLE